MYKAPLNDSIQIRKTKHGNSGIFVLDQGGLTNNYLYYHLATRRIRYAITDTSRGKETIWVNTKLY